MPWVGSVEIPPGSGCFKVPEAVPGDPLHMEFVRTFDSSQCYPLSPFTDAGLVVLSGPVPTFDSCPTDSGCVVAYHLPTDTPPISPTGERIKDDKPSSLLSLHGRLYFAGHSPSVEPTEGYIAISDDHGLTWFKVPGSPWTGSSPFRVLMLLNMGRDYELNSDGYVYGFGIAAEFRVPEIQNVYLARVPIDSVADYGEYEYLSGLRNNIADWSASQSRAVPLGGLHTHVTGSALYHPRVARYLFLSGLTSITDQHGTLYESPQPWGPWTAAGEVRGAHISSLISKGSESTSVFFTAAGGTSPYKLNISRIDMQLRR